MIGGCKPEDSLTFDSAYKLVRFLPASLIGSESDIQSSIWAIGSDEYRDM